MPSEKGMSAEQPIKSAEELAQDVCNRCWHEITPDHPFSVREISQVIEAHVQARLLAAEGERDHEAKVRSDQAIELIRIYQIQRVTLERMEKAEAERDRLKEALQGVGNTLGRPVPAYYSAESQHEAQADKIEDAVAIVMAALK